MKRVLCVALALAMGSAAFTGCQKDGVYNPKKKISKIQKADNGNKVLVQEWTWNGNLLHNIAYYLNDSVMQGKEYFLYEKKQLVRIDNTNLSYYVISYNGSQYEKIELFDRMGKKTRTYVYGYDGKKVSKIDLTVYKNPSKSAMDIAGENSLMSFFLPMSILEETDRQIARFASLKSADDDVYSFTLKYDGDNVSEWKMGDYNNEEKPLEVVFKYESYDKNVNPLYASRFEANEKDIMPFAPPCFYKNNPTKASSTRYDNGKELTINYDYTYKYVDKKYPAEIVRKQSQESMPESISDTTYYEYK
ncbi:MAG: hypothetical protein FWH36_07410 [Lentimicrobiaceae bacterium]|nr:hypothetical protein [Lentimicrobiaceae bacterium]